MRGAGLFSVLVGVLAYYGADSATTVNTPTPLIMSGNSQCVVARDGPNAQGQYLLTLGDCMRGSPVDFVYDGMTFLSA